MSTRAQEVALDRLLVDRIRSGDEQAFNEMVRRYWDRIYSMVHQLLRNQQDAEEVTQDAFIRAHRGLAKFRGDDPDGATLSEVIPSEVETPDDITVTTEFTERVAECMEKLGKKHREILVLRNVQNHSYEEVAEVLGISVGTVKSRIARAREALRELLGEEFQ